MFWKYTEGNTHKPGIFYNFNDMANTLFIVGCVLPLLIYKKKYRDFRTGDFKEGWFCYGLLIKLRVRNNESVKKGNKRIVFHISSGSGEIGKHRLIMTEEEYEERIFKSY